MTGAETLADSVYAWLAADPDPAARAELVDLDDHALAERFAAPLRFGTAGLRGPVRAGPAGMNRLVVRRATRALAAWLRQHPGETETVVVGCDARHGSAEFAAEAVEVMRQWGFDVVALTGTVPTPVLAHTTRALHAAAGIMVTASHNPPADNGYKVYLGGDDLTRGAQLVPPADAAIEHLMTSDPHPAVAQRVSPVSDTDPRAAAAVEAYLARLVERFGTGPRPVRVALTAMHGVGGAIAVQALRTAGVTDIAVVAEQFDPDPDFPTVAFPNPEEPGAADMLLDLARAGGADVAIALDPDADRCAVGCLVDGRWRMLTGDETGALLADHLLTDRVDADRDPASTHGAAAVPLVASTIVSGSLVEKVCAHRGARFARTLTGFKWLVRAGGGLLYAYEEAIGHCVDPDAVRDKDGIATAVAVTDLVHRRLLAGSDLAGALDDLTDRHGVHLTGQVAHRTEDLSSITAAMTRLRTTPPETLLDHHATVDDFATRDDGLRTDAVSISAGDDDTRLRIIVRPSGTEPKVKAYLEVALAPDPDRAAARVRADALLDRLRSAARSLVAGTAP
ncbi:phospho-sugar mutase [Williamsia deligens]|uniref:Phospho-sugar mutase n=1 Tax=Williamsia deligens TaxID=321325 RepID=A0ABW3GC83_9NOCA|nr:phospho-sugar mutase [Williamsia deligens]MCP2196156.1 phosphomannomutase [Williamsia deligens]